MACRLRLVRQSNLVWIQRSEKLWHDMRWMHHCGNDYLSRHFHVIVNHWNFHRKPVQLADNIWVLSQKQNWTLEYWSRRLFLSILCRKLHPRYRWKQAHPVIQQLKFLWALFFLLWRGKRHKTFRIANIIRSDQMYRLDQWTSLGWKAPSRKRCRH